MLSFSFFNEVIYLKILYVTNAWTALSPVLYDGDSEIQGMPGFVKVLEKLIAEGNEVDIIFFDFKVRNKYKKYNISSKWFKDIKIIDHFYIKERKKIAKVITQLITYIKIAIAVDRAVKNKGYDLIYGHHPLSEAASHAAKKHKIPFGLRRYGDNYWSLIERRGLFYAIISNPVNYYAYRNKKSFMLATKDGSKIDEAYNLINKGKKPYDFYLWLNGTPLIKSINTKKSGECKKPYLFYAARIVRSKRQHLAMEIIKLLKENNVRVNLYLAGQKDDNDYYAFLFDRARQYGIEDQVFYLGSVAPEQLRHMSSEALASLSLYDFCNLGNVLIEYLTAGALVISINDGSLDNIIRNGENGFLVDNMQQAVLIIENLLKDRQSNKVIKNKAKETARKCFMTWDKRVEKEVTLLKSYTS